ncbi:MAG: ATP-dependent DNA ligase, partial [Patescibacteria group bacterium]|nr:ATP-dependent DNA ligase [Patescibacteria group bacterium]
EVDMESFKPMLAGRIEKAVNDVSFPVLASHKLDGVRAVVLGGVVLSRSLKPIPNVHVQRQFGDVELTGLDGELIVGDPTAADAFRHTTSVVMSEDADIKGLKLWVFDSFRHPHISYRERMRDLKLWAKKNKLVRVVQQFEIGSLSDLYGFEAGVLGDGYEGIMVRSPEGRYKFGRSTVREGALLKLKRFRDSEAEVLGIEEQMQNNNAAIVNELGRTARSSHQKNKSGKNTLGRVFVRDLHTGVKFHIGTGFDDALRKQIWDDPASYLGLILRYTYFPIGGKDKPRMPVFNGFRDAMDLGGEKELN